MNSIYIIGAGGVGSWLAPAMCKLVKPENIIVVDGDKLEKKNLDRQLFDPEAVNLNKAQALAAIYDCRAKPEYFTAGVMAIDRNDFFMVCVDNNPARVSVLETCDSSGAQAIFGSNEVSSAEAFYYNPAWKGSPHDPRIYYPEIVTDTRFDPRHKSIGCTGEAQEKNRQLVSANISAMSLMLQLYGIWQLDIKKFKREALQYLPYRLNQNQTKFETMTINKKEELCQQTKQKNPPSEQ
jgi:molybdopterin/thiamine biosynthesis adenylyltransferase